MSGSSGLFTVLDALDRWAVSRDFAGVDPYDGLAATRVPSRLKAATRTRQALVQAAKRSPVDVRGLTGTRPRRIAKALGLYAGGYASLSQTTWDGQAKERGSSLLAWLAEHHGGAEETAAWGYEFDVQTRWAFYPAGSPNIIATTFVAAAFLDWYECSHEPSHLEEAKRACRFLLAELLRDGSQGSYFAYVPGVSTLVHNANLLGCALVASCGSAAEQADWVTIARDAAETTLRATDERGLWSYGEGLGLEWIDGLHTAYTLGALHNVWCAAGDAEVLGAIRRGLDAYIRLLFTPQGVPRYSDRSLYPIDIHCASSAIDLFVRLRDVDERCWDLATGVARWTIAEMYDPSGFFYYQKTRWYTNKIPYIRWSQAHMFRALARMAAAMPQ